MLRELSWADLKEWAAFYELEPFGEKRADYRSAQITQAIYNVNRDTRKQPQPFKLEEFLLDFGEKRERKKQTWQEQKAIAITMAKAFAKGNRRRRKPRRTNRAEHRRDHRDLVAQG